MIKVERNDMKKKLTIIDLGKKRLLVDSIIEDGEVVDLTCLALEQKPLVIQIVQKLKDMKFKGFYFHINNVNAKKIEDYKNNNHCLARTVNWATRLQDKKLVFELLY